MKHREEIEDVMTDDVLLHGVVNMHRQQHVDSPIMSPAERHQLLVAWNDTATELPPQQHIHALFEAQVERTPDAVAAVVGDSRLSYRELNTKANQLAHHLIAKGVGPDVLVGLCVERSLNMLVGLLGILKAGGAYVPLDPLYPRDRIAFMLDDAQAPLLLTQQGLLKDLPQGQRTNICLDSDWPLIAQEGTENPDASARGAHLAYILYTSGSTGRPKGVQIPHRALVNFLNSMRQAPGLTAQDVLLAVTTLSFDIAALEIFLPLITGARTVLVSRDTATDGSLLVKQIEQHGVTFLQATPATWRMLIASGWQRTPGLKMLCGGEALSRDLAEQLLPRGDELWNMYGPTETTVWSTIHRVTSHGTPPPIGCPIANTQVYLLDEQLNPVPVGVAGELHLGGQGLARGYHNRPELTAEKFIPNPFGPPGSRLYKTGDLARYRPDGVIEYLGRIDHQVKIRGFRIELGEIEVRLCQHPHVREAVVIAREDSPGDQRLVAYLVRSSGKTPEQDDLRAFLKETLPEYMLPSAFVILPALPLTPNGKLDRKALPVPQVSAQFAHRYVAPTTDTEKLLVDIWEKILKLERVGIQDNFFELGGHSLSAAHLISDIRKILGLILPLTSLFQNPTIEQLAVLLHQNNRIVPDYSALVAIQPSGSRPPFFCVPGGSGRNLFGMHQLSRHLGEDQPFYALHSAALKAGPAKGRIEDIAADYVFEIKKVQPQGPYYVGGECIGALVAYEIAQQLQAQGEQVAFLVLIEADLGIEDEHAVAERLRMKEYLASLGRKERGRLLVEKVVRRAIISSKRLAYKGCLKLGVMPAVLREEYVAAMNVQAQRAYLAQPYQGQLTLLWANKDIIQRQRYQDTYRAYWERLVSGRVESYDLSGDHFSIFREPQVQYLADQLSQCLCSARRLVLDRYEGVSELTNDLISYKSQGVNQ